MGLSDKTGDVVRTVQVGIKIVVILTVLSTGCGRHSVWCQCRVNFTGSKLWHDFPRTSCRRRALLKSQNVKVYFEIFDSVAMVGEADKGTGA